MALERWRHLSRLSQQRLDADHSDFTTSEAPLIRGEPEHDLHAFPTAGSVTLRHRPQMLCTHRFPNPEHDRWLPTDAWIIVGECGSLLRSWR